MGQPSDLSFEADGPLAYGALAIVERALAENAVRVRPDVKAVEAGLQATEAETALVQAEQTFPAVNLSARYEFSREAEARQHRAVLGLSVPLPVFNRREGDLEIAMARRSKQAARLDLVKATISAQVMPRRWNAFAPRGASWSSSPATSCRSSRRISSCCARATNSASSPLRRCW